MRPMMEAHAAAPPVAGEVRAEPRARRDPAPSRMAYRLHRLRFALMPRASLRFGLPAAAALGAALWFAADPARLDAVAETVREIRRSVEQRPEFMVAVLDVRGASPKVSADIRGVLPIDFPVSSFDLDLPAMRRKVMALGAVADADIHIRSGGVLELAVAERVPAMIWLSRQGVEFLDAAGHRVGPVDGDPASFGLPLVSGDGADRAAAEALRLTAVAAGSLGGRLLGLVRVGERRWDVRLVDGPRVLLPAEDPLPALRRVLALNDAWELLGRDLAVVDMRLPDRPTLRMTAASGGRRPTGQIRIKEEE